MPPKKKAKILPIEPEQPESSTPKFKLPNIIKSPKGEEILPFYAKTSPFSNHFPIEFEADGHTFHSSEQYFMYRKAKHFQDSTIMAELAAERNPVKCKALGRKVANFVSVEWEKHRFEAMVDALFLKFSQNPELRSLLIQSGDATFVEASPRDRIWGVGMGVANSQIGDPTKWKGRNLMGKALAEARQRIQDG